MSVPGTRAEQAVAEKGWERARGLFCRCVVKQHMHVLRCSVQTVLSPGVVFKYP